MTPQTIALILDGVTLIGTIAPVAVETALRIKALLETPETGFSVQIQIVRDGAIASAEETLAMIDEWRRSKGLQ